MDAVTEIHFIILFTLLVLAFFIVSLILFIQGRKAPGKYPENTIKTRKILLIVSSVILGAVAAVYIAVGALLSIAIAYM